MAAPLASEKVKVNVCADPLPLLGETDTATGADGAPPVTFNVAEALWLSAPLVPVTVTG